jgi:hypothetical protein
MDVQLESMKDAVDEKFSYLGLKEGNATAEKVMELINREDFRAASGTMAPMAENRPKILSKPIPPRETE